MADEKKGFSEAEQAELKATYSEIEKNLGTKMADKVKADVEAAIAPIQNELSELKKYKVDAEKTMADNQKWIDEQIAKGNTVKVENDNTVSGAFSKAFKEKEQELKNYGKTRTPISFELKTVGNIGANSNISVSGTPDFVHGGPLFQPGRKGFETRHIRDLMRVVAAPEGMDTFVVRDNGGEGAPTIVAAGAAKPQSDRDWVKTIIPVAKFAHYYKVPEEYLQDISWMQEEITGVGVEELLTLEDTKILTASASGSQWAGLNQTFNSTAYSTPSGLAAYFTGAARDANNYDVLVAALTQLRLTNPSSIANVCLLNPLDYAKLLLEKDTTNQYIFGAPNTAIPSVMGVSIVSHNSVTSDKFFIGDFTKVKVGVKSGLSVRFFDQDQDDAIKNLVTVIIEERITMAADRADRIIYGDFSDAQTALES